jgi:hypothetical protein
MELINFDGLTLGSVVASVGATIVIWLITQLARWTTKIRLLSRIYFLFANKFLWRMFASIVCSLLVAIVAGHVPLEIFGQPLNAPFIGALTLSFLLMYSQWNFARIGLHAAQTSVTAGTDYRAALDLCRDSFSFLGTGAFKLTSEKNFEETLLRCNSDNEKPVRLLLSTPDNPLITDAERKAGVTTGTYKENVIKSLRNLKRLKDEKNARFEVRFYKAETERDFENFRIMLIDDDIMLLSYNVYGRNSAGRKTPQTVLFKSSMTSSSDNFYFAFQGYFERLWASSASWDFQTYV